MTAKTDKTAAKLKVLGIYQIAGGISGFYYVYTFTSNLPASTTASFFLLLAFVFLLCLYSMICGITVLTKNTRALKLSLINQYMQLIGFSLQGYAFYYSSGSSLLAGVNITHGFFLNAHFRLFSFASILIATDSDVIEIYMNLIPLFIIIFINNLNKRLQSENQRKEIEEIGSDI